MDAAEFSTVVESDVAVVADRTMSWDLAHGYGGHAETSVPAAALTWYLAETAVAHVKPVPVTVTGVPTGPSAGWNAVRVGGEMISATVPAVAPLPPEAAVIAAGLNALVP